MMREARTPWLGVVVLAVTANLGAAATRAYFVEPKTASNGWTEPGQNAYVGQTFRANVDSIAYLDWFVLRVSHPSGEHAG